MATIVEVTSRPLLSFADLLRTRQADILADWHNAARSEFARVSSNGSDRIDVVLNKWLGHIIAVAERRSASVGSILSGARQNGTTLADLALLHRLVARRAHVDQVEWGLDESELLWGALEAAIAELTATDHTPAQLTPTRDRAADGGKKPRERFLGEASRALAESLDYEGTLKTVARLAVSEIADWCNIDLLNADGQLVRVASEHRHLDHEHLVEGLRQHPPQHDAVSGAPNVIRSGVTEFVPRMSESLLQERESIPERISLLRSLRLNSTICTPLVARGRVLGAITLSTSIGRQLTVDEVGMAEDLAQRAAIAIDNARLYGEAQRAVRTREEVLAIVTHDLRTPLSAVTAGASLLVSMDSVEPDGARIKQRGETIQRAAQHMSRLITDLTDLAQIDAGRLAIDKTMESPADVVREAIEALEPVVMRRGGALHAKVNADAPSIPLDRDRVRQVLANLVGNANKVGASEISVGAEPRGADVVFWVADNGPGIPRQDLPRMFDRYFRRAGTEYEGSGLGLPISNGIVKAHGGRMWIESTAGSGSTFYFSIPR